MNHTITLQAHDGSTTVIPFDNTITIATLIKQYREQTGHSGYIEFFDMDHPTEHPVEQAVVIDSNQTFIVQKSAFEAIPDKDTLQRLVDCYDILTDKDRERYGPIEHWNISLITDLSALFMDQEAFNQPLNNWNVSNVTDMCYMFSDAIAFNQPLDSWDVSNVTTMTAMFQNAKVFNQPLDSWNVSNVTTMNCMFRGAFAFNQPLNNWNVGNVTDMCSLFGGVEVFNQTVEQLECW